METVSQSLVGKEVSWVEDLRPDPDHPFFTPDSISDTSLITQKTGVIQAITRTFFGNWMALVQTDETFVDIPVNDLKVLNT